MKDKPTTSAEQPETLATDPRPLVRKSTLDLLRVRTGLRAGNGGGVDDDPVPEPEPEPLPPFPVS